VSPGVTVVLPEDQIDVSIVDGKSKYNKPSQLAIVLATSSKNLGGREIKEAREWSRLHMKSPAAHIFQGKKLPFTT
jgi:hypothetical protein